MYETFLSQSAPDLLELAGDAAGALAAEAKASGFSVFEIDGPAMKTKTALMEHIAGRLSFPGDFGANWDALIDYLGDMATIHRTGKTLVILRRYSELEAADAALYGKLKEIFGLSCENARQWSKGSVLLKFALAAD